MSKDESETVRFIREGVEAKRREIAGPVELRVLALKNEYVAAQIPAQRSFLESIAGRPITEEEVAAFEADLTEKLQVPSAVEAIVTYLEEEHERRATWERTTVERLDALERNGAS